MIYILVILLLLFGLKFDKYLWSNKALWFYRLEWIILVLLSGLRYKIGGDTMVYMDQYPYLPSLSEISWQEALFNIYGFQPLYMYFVAICKTISEDYIFFQIIHAFLINGVVFWFVKKYAKMPFLVIVFYFFLSYFNYNMEIMKQSFTNCCFLLSVPFLLNKQWLKYFLIAIVGFGFHSAGVFMFLLPAFFHSLGKRNVIKYTLYLIIGLFCISKLSVAKEILNSINLFALSGDLDTYGDDVANVNGLILGLITKLLLPYIYLLCYRGDNKYEQSFTALYVIFLGFSVSLVFLYRIVDMFEIPFYVAVINYYYDLKSKRTYSMERQRIKDPLTTNRSIVFAVILWLFMIRFAFYTQDLSPKIGMQAHRYDLYLPYESVISPDENRIREALFYNFVN